MCANLGPVAYRYEASHRKLHFFRTVSMMLITLIPALANYSLATTSRSRVGVGVWRRIFLYSLPPTIWEDEKKTLLIFGRITLDLYESSGYCTVRIVRYDTGDLRVFPARSKTLQCALPGNWIFLESYVIIIICTCIGKTHTRSFEMMYCM